MHIYRRKLHQIQSMYSVDCQWRLGRSITFFVLVNPYLFNAVKRVWIDQDVIDNDSPHCIVHQINHPIMKLRTENVQLLRKSVHSIIVIKSENNHDSIYRRHWNLIPKNQSINHNQSDHNGILIELFHALTKAELLQEGIFSSSIYLPETF